MVTVAMDTVVTELAISQCPSTPVAQEVSEMVASVSTIIIIVFKPDIFKQGKWFMRRTRGLIPTCDGLCPCARHIICDIV